jgi:hypothetical protein
VRQGLGATRSRSRSYKSPSSSSSSSPTRFRISTNFLPTLLQLFANFLTTFCTTFFCHTFLHSIFKIIRNFPFRIGPGPYSRSLLAMSLIHSITLACIRHAGIWESDFARLQTSPDCQARNLGLQNSGWLVKFWLAGLGKTITLRFYRTLHCTFTHLHIETPIYTHEQIVSVFHPYFIRLMIKCDRFYANVSVFASHPAPKKCQHPAEFYKTCLPQLTRPASANFQH